MFKIDPLPLVYSGVYLPVANLHDCPPGLYIAEAVTVVYSSIMKLINLKFSTASYVRDVAIISARSHFFKDGFRRQPSS